VKEKVLAAHRAGVRTVILPEENRKDLDEIPRHVRRSLRFVFVERMDQILSVALLPLPVSEELEDHAAIADKGEEVTQQPSASTYLL
jgi:ATP-dependent Lon protease